MIITNQSASSAPVIRAAGKLAYVLCSKVDNPKNVMLWSFLPNGAMVDYGAGPKRILATGNTPEEAWEKAAKNAELMGKFGIDLQ